MKNEIDYSEVEEALRKNGLAVIRKGNRNKLEMGRDGKTLVVYGTLLYSPHRDKEFVSDKPLINHIVARVKAQAMKNPPIPKSGEKKSHHKPGEKYEHHKKDSTGKRLY